MDGKNVDGDGCGIIQMNGSSGRFPESLSIAAIRCFIDMVKGINVKFDDSGSSDPISILDHYGLLCDDGTITCAGALLFSEHPSGINRGAFVKICRSPEGGVPKKGAIVDSPLILVPERVMSILYGEYISAYAYPKSVIGEIIINAIVHRDYSSEEPVTVSVCPDMVVIFSPGGLPDGWTVETLMGKHRSIPRNPTLADVFHDAGCMEGWAQGIRRVSRSCETNGNPPPEFVIERGGLSVTVYPGRSRR